MTCVVLFTVCSFLVRHSAEPAVLIFARVLQGAGGGGLQPSEQAILADTFPAEKRGMAFRNVRHGGGGGAGYRTHAGRLDHRQFQLALDLLHQHSGRVTVAVSDVALRGRSALAETKKSAPA